MYILNGFYAVRRFLFVVFFTHDLNRHEYFTVCNRF